MKILMIAPEPFLTPRGTPISVYQRIFALSRIGYQVDLLTYPVGECVNLPGLTIYRVPNIPFIKNIKVGPSWAKLFLDIMLVLKAILLLATNDYDVVHSHEEASFFAAPIAKLFHVKHVYDMHSSLPMQLENFQFGNVRPIVKLFELLERLVIRTADTVITIGADLDSYVRKIDSNANVILIENLPIQITVPESNTDVLNDISQRLGINGNPIVIYTGTFEHYQGLSLLFDSAKIVIENYPNVSFLLIGGNDIQIQYWTQAAKDMGLEKSVQFLGTVPIVNIPYFLNLATVLVSPRLVGTSIPLKLYTYLLSGKPIVATNTMAHKQILLDDLAIIVNSNENDFAEGILRILREPQLGSIIGQRAKAFGEENFCLERYLNELDLAYRWAVQTK